MNTLANEIFLNLFKRYPGLIENKRSIKIAFAIMQESIINCGKIIVCGNGGSAADSEHIVGELMKGFLMKRQICDKDRERLITAFPDGNYLADHLQKSIPAVSLVNAISLNSAFCNDVAPDMTYAQAVYGLGNTGDVLIGITTSGNSSNVVNAVKIASSKNIKTIGMTGIQGGSLKELCDVCICVPECETYLVQEYHLPVYHALCAMLEAENFG